MGVTLTTTFMLCVQVNPDMVSQLESAGLSFAGKDETGSRMEVCIYLHETDTDLKICAIMILLVVVVIVIIILVIMVMSADC